MACRSLERARVAADEIKLKTGVDDSRLIVMQLDVSSLSSVRSFASSFKTSSYYTHSYHTHHAASSIITDLSDSKYLFIHLKTKKKHMASDKMSED